MSEAATEPVDEPVKGLVNDTASESSFNSKVHSESDIVSSVTIGSTTATLSAIASFASRSAQYLLLLLVGGVVAGGFAGVLMSLIYWLLVVLPGSVWVSEEGWLEGFVLSNLTGFAMAGVSVALELLFGLPLSAVVLVGVPIIFLAVGAWRKFRVGEISRID